MDGSETTEPKPPAAVVYLERADGRVLAVPRKDESGGPDYADWHLPGGKHEGKDGRAYESAPVSAFAPDLVATAIREVHEETGLQLERDHLRPILDYRTRSGRLVRLFVAEGVPWLPAYFPTYPGGVPAWVPAAMLSLPWCRLADEAQIILRAVAAYRRRGRPSIFPAQAAAERMVYEDGGGR